eukprot:GHRR01008895.1.p1 GENE.GHRR01008895.1~~GHRR01008895.1.p1  ORF type:complete len:321 (+),score=112.30 GHRR01008895.1:946-1908(+)
MGISHPQHAVSPSFDTSSFVTVCCCLPVCHCGEVIDQAVVNGSIDLAVHSLKDQPVLLPVGVILAACLPREDSRDVFISRKAKTPGSLPAGSRVGTSSMRRKAQLLYAHPHLKVVPVRGNIDKRMEMMADGQLDAIVLAAAGLLRMGQLHLATGILGFDEMLPAGCQGAVGVTCQSSDQGIRRELALINHEATMLEVTAERALVAQLLDTANNRPHLGEADSSSSTSTSGQQGAAAAHTSSITGLRMLPNFAIACHAGFDPHEGVLTLDGLVASEDGKVVDRLQQSGGVTDPADAESIGRTLGQQLRQFARDHGWLQAQA